MELEDRWTLMGRGDSHDQIEGFDRERLEGKRRLAPLQTHIHNYVYAQVGMGCIHKSVYMCIMNGLYITRASQFVLECKKVKFNSSRGYVCRVWILSAEVWWRQQMKTFWWHASSSRPIVIPWGHPVEVKLRWNQPIPQQQQQQQQQHSLLSPCRRFALWIKYLRVMFWL